jgi:hypothetical protein
MQTAEILMREMYISSLWFVRGLGCRGGGLKCGVCRVWSVGRSIPRMMHSLFSFAKFIQRPLCGVKGYLAHEKLQLR